MTKYPPAKTGGYPRISPNFQNCARCVKDLKDNKHDSLHLGENMLGYLSLDIICSSKLTVFVKLRSQKTVCFSEQIMSAVYIYTLSNGSLFNSCLLDCPVFTLLLAMISTINLRGH